MSISSDFLYLVRIFCVAYMLIVFIVLFLPQFILSVPVYRVCWVIRCVIPLSGVVFVSVKWAYTTADSGLTDTYSTATDGRSCSLHCRSFDPAWVHPWSYQALYHCRHSARDKQYEYDCGIRYKTHKTFMAKQNKKNIGITNDTICK